MRKLALLFILATTLSHADQPKRYIFFVRPIQQKEMDSVVRHVPQENKLRVAQLKQTFKDVQCGDFHEQAFAGGRNLLCNLQGGTTDTVLFVAHYEHGGKGMAAVDNWSGAMMLPFLYYALTATPRQHSFIFAEFDGEEGSKAYMRSLNKTQLHAIKAVVAVDALGVGVPSFYVRPNGTYPSPIEQLLETTLQLAAIDKNVPAIRQEIPGHWMTVDDTRQFRYRNIPTVLIHSVTYQSHDIPGSEKDTAEAIDADQYYAAYQLLCYFVAELDLKKLDTTPDTPTPTARRGRR
jgi:aminopeptidase-like protein